LFPDAATVLVTDAATVLVTDAATVLVTDAATVLVTDAETVLVTDAAAATTTDIVFIFASTLPDRGTRRRKPGVAILGGDKHGHERTRDTLPTRFSACLGCRPRYRRRRHIAGGREPTVRESVVAAMLFVTHRVNVRQTAHGHSPHVSPRLRVIRDAGCRESTRLVQEQECFAQVLERFACDHSHR
jgi:hypothetical protein